MRILMVSPYPPLRDGIANYAVQVVMALEDEGHHVEVLSPGPSAAHHHLDLHSGARGVLALTKRARNFDRLIIQWHPAFFYATHDDRHRIEVDLALIAMCKAVADVEVWVHEFEHSDAVGTSLRNRVARQMWRSVHRLYFHSEFERSEFLRVTGADPARALLGEHGAAFRKRTQATRETARESLGIGAEEFVFLAIGFIQQHKGFDRGIRAFAGLDERGARFDVVGSTRLDHPDFIAYLKKLEDLVARTPGAHLHRGYVSDELFDRWIVASDVVVLPYREIWSSGVMERAALYDRPVIATKVGGLAMQAAGRDVTLVDDDRGLRDAMLKALGEAQTLDAAPWPDDGPDLWERVQAEVVARAERVRGHALGRAENGSPAPVAPDPMTPLLHLGHLHRAAPRGVKARLVDRMLGREVGPLVHFVNRLRDATLSSVQVLETEVEAQGPPPGPSSSA